MNIKTESIIELLESILNKKINNITVEDLEKIDYLKISRTSIDDILTVDSSDLQYFHNLKELSIDSCMIDNKFIDNLIKLKNIKKISFNHCDFISDAKEYFEKILVEELVLNDVIGLDNISLSNINKLTFINCSFDALVNTNILDISRSIDINIDFNSSNIKELIINKEEYINNNLPKCKIIIKDSYDEIIKVIEND